MPLKRYPEWKELDFELNDKQIPLVIRVDDEPEECSEESPQPISPIQKKTPEPVAQSKEAQATSPLLFCQESIHQEIKELKKRVPDYKEFREKKNPKQYCETTQAENEIINLEVGFFIALIGFFFPLMMIFIFLLEKPWRMLSEFSIKSGIFFLAIYLVGALLGFIREHRAGKRRGSINIPEEILGGFTISGCIFFVAVIIYLILCKVNGWGSP